MKKITATLGGAALLGSLAACSRSYTIEAPIAPASPAQAAPATTATDSYSVSCKMATGPYNGFTGGPAWVPRITVKNTGSTTLHLPDLAVSDAPLNFSVVFLSTSGQQVNEDDAVPLQQSTATIAPGASFTFTTLNYNGVVNDDQSQDSVKVTACTATMTDGY